MSLSSLIEVLPPFARYSGMTGSHIVSAIEGGYYEAFDSIDTCLGIVSPPTCYLSNETHKHPHVAVPLPGPHILILENILNTGLWNDYVEECSRFITLSVYLSNKFVCNLFELILRCPNEDVAEKAAMALSKMFDLHPPCAPNMRTFYLHLLTSQQGGTICKELLKTSIDTLISELHPSAGTNGSKEAEAAEGTDSTGRHGTRWGTDGSVEHNSDSRMMGEGDWLPPLVSMLGLEKLTCTSRHGRLFRVLSLVLQLLSSDLLTCNYTLTPLLSTLLPLAEPIMSLYICSIEAGVQCNVAMRLVSMLAVVTQVEEFRPENRYPYFGEKTRGLAHSLYTKLGHMDGTVIMNQMSKLSPSWLVMWVTYHFISAARIHRKDPSYELVLWCLKKGVVPEKAGTGGPLQPLDNPEQESKSDTSDVSGMKLSKRKERNMKGESHLHVLSRSKRLEELRQELEEDAGDVNATDNYGWTPLLEAVSAGWVENVRLLLAHGADPWQRCEGRTSPLVSACEGNYPDIIQILLEHTEGRLLLEEITGSGRVVDLAHSPAVLEALEEGEKLWRMPEWVAHLLPVYLMAYEDTYSFWKIIRRLISPRGAPVDRRCKLRLDMDYGHFTNDCRDRGALRVHIEASKRTRNGLGWPV